MTGARIERIRLVRVRAMPEAPLRLIAQLDAADGSIGLGETVGDAARWAMARERAGALLGLDALAHEARLACTSAGALADAASAAVAGALDLALWDLKARGLGVPLHRLLAGEPQARVPVAAVLELASGDALSRGVDLVRSRGHECLQLVAGALDPSKVVVTAGQLRRELGDVVALRLAAGGGWPLLAATRLVPELEALGLEFLEDPVGSLDGLARVREVCAAPLAAGGLVREAERLAAALRAGALDVLVIDPAAWGGLGPFQDAAAACASFGVDIALDAAGGSEVALATVLQLRATLRTVPLAVQGVAGEHRPLTRETLEVRNGRLPVPEGHGIGVTLDEERLAALAIDVHTQGAEPARP